MDRERILGITTNDASKAFGGYGRLGQHERAIQDLNEAIRLDPQDAIVHLNRGVAYRAMGKSAEAERDFAKAKELGYVE